MKKKKKWERKKFCINFYGNMVGRRKACIWENECCVSHLDFVTFSTRNDTKI